MIAIYAISSAAGCGATSEAPHPLRELVKRLSIGLPATVTERFAWCNVRPIVGGLLEPAPARAAGEAWPCWKAPFSSLGCRATSTDGATIAARSSRAT
jgi:hypothetical protein